MKYVLKQFQVGLERDLLFSKAVGFPPAGLKCLCIYDSFQCESDSDKM